MTTTLLRRAALLCLGLCPMAAAAAPPQEEPLVTIETTGDEVVGRLVALDSERLVRLRESTDRRLTIEEVLTVRVEGGRALKSTSPVAGEVELVDGSRFEYVEALFSEDAIRFALREGVRLTAPVAEIATWRVGADAATDAVDEPTASDLLVVKRRDGGYTPVAGVVLSVTEAGVRFALEDDEGAQPVDAPWSRIGAIRFYRTGEGPDGATPVVLTLADGGRIAADRLQYAGGQAEWPGGAAPIGAITSIDLSAGRVVPVADLKLLGADWTPYFPTGGEGHAFDHSLSGGELKLRFPDRRAPGAWPAVSVERRFARGAALRSRGELRFALPEGAKRLRGWIGLDPDSALAGAAEVTVLADGKPFWSGGVDEATTPHALDASITRATALTLRVDYGDNLDAGDFVNFCDLRVIR